MSGGTRIIQKWHWNESREKAAFLVAQDKLLDVEIAAECGVAKVTLERYKRVPVFRERVDAIREEIRQKVCSRGYADMAVRVEELTGILDRYKAIMSARGEEYGKKANKVPGGETGLIVRNFRVIGTGQNSRVVSEHVFDRGLSAEFRAALDDVAKEVGGRINKTDMTTAGQPFKVYLTPEVESV